MAKVLLVEDDNNLREIFEMRLQAEGYQTLTAGDGEEGLSVAMKEKPDLIIADVMMPKLSGFDMLETLRAAPEMKNTKVIMMTALGQAEDQDRGKSLGVIKYLVKSQATLEDFARTVKEVLPDAPSGSAPTQVSNQESEKNMQDPATNPTPPAGDSPAPATPASDPMAPPTSNPVMGSDTTPADAGQMTSADESSNVQSQINDFVGSAPSTDSPAPAADSTAPAAPATPSDPAPAADPAATNPMGDTGSATEPTTTESPDIPVATPPPAETPATPEQSDAPDQSGGTPATPAV